MINILYPHIDKICAKLNGGRYFCKLDISRAYLHVQVDNESAKIQTIFTHLGNFHVKRLFFGIKTAPSVFQQFMDEILGHMEGVSIFFDDIKIQGASEEECLKRLETVLEILKQNGIKLNKEKCNSLQNQSSI